MTIFLIGTCEETAQELDPKRLNRQIQECNWLIGMIEGTIKWKNHPCNFMYREHHDWLILYRDCLKAYKNKDLEECKRLSEEAEKIKPEFLCEGLYENFKRRLYTKDSSHYAKWEYLGTSEKNYYFVGGEWLLYENGKKVVVDRII